MKALKNIVRLLAFAFVVAAFWGLPYCNLAVRGQRFLWAVVLTLLAGRFFCDVLCPLGILQSLVNWIFHPHEHVRRVCSRLPETKAQRIVRWGLIGAVVALGASGCMGLATGLFPMSVFGRVVSVVRAQAERAPCESAFAAVSVAVLALVLVLAAIGRGRIWCNWICPYGTVFALIAKIACRRDRIARGCGCGTCRQCFGASDGRAGTSSAPTGTTRRETLKGVAMLAVADKLTDGGYAGVSLPGVPDRKVPVLPPGAGKRSVFALKCVACQLCVSNCPGKCLKPSLRLNAFGQPELDFRHGHCIASCVKCGEVCPEGAIEKLRDVNRKNVHMGVAAWSRDLCIRTTEKVECTACVRKCPVHAIHVVKGFPVVDADACIGCGACEHVCPARPMPAIAVEGLEIQRIVRPVGADDVRAELADPVDDVFAYVKPGNF